MTKTMRELLQQIDNKHQESANFLAQARKEEDKEKKKELMNKSKQALEEMKALQEEYRIEEQLLANEKENAKGDEKTPENSYKKEFINGIRNRFRNAMSVGSDPDGGYTVPQDIQTKINEYREQKDALTRFVTVEPVSTMKGSRVFKKRSQQTGFVKVGEGAAIGEQTTPQFETLEYEVAKYAGFFKVTNELLQDSDQAIESTLVSWIGDESRVTRNKLILEALNAKPRTALQNVDDIKKAVNVTLDPAFHNTSILLTNQDGFNWLDTLKDNDGNYLLQPSVSSPTGKRIGLLDIVMVSNKDLPSQVDDENVKAPMIIGDLKEAVVLFDRKSLAIAVSDIAMDAFETDVTYFRAIERLDVKLRDDEAFIYGEVII